MTRRILLAAGVLLTAIATTGAAASATERHEHADVVIEWNQILQRTLPATAAVMAPRFYSMMHIAMFDAANSVEPAFHPYRIRVGRAHGASADIAAAQAAHDVLVALIPAAAPTYRAALDARLASRRHGKAARAVAIGQHVAAEILAWREHDGWLAPEPGWSQPAFPGLYQLTPGLTAVTFTRAPGVAPFALLTVTQYLPPPPPTLTSERYAADFNEVKSVGGATGAMRTTDQTNVARLWAGVASLTRTNLWAVWGNITRDAAMARGLSLVETARLFALVYVSIHDGLLTTLTSKWVYGLWRPVTAIHRADEDLNPLTSPDPMWMPLLGTPSYPAYAGNMACVGASAATALARVLGTNEMPVTIVWRTPDDMADAGVRHYPGFWEAAQEQERSRVWGGIHYTFDGEASQLVCPKVADFAVAHYMQPRR